VGFFHKKPKNFASKKIYINTQGDARKTGPQLSEVSLYWMYLNCLFSYILNACCGFFYKKPKNLQAKKKI
jgi:hypothetical protein